MNASVQYACYVMHLLSTKMFHANLDRKSIICMFLNGRKKSVNCNRVFGGVMKLALK